MPAALAEACTPADLQTQAAWICWAAWFRLTSAIWCGCWTYTSRIYMTPAYSRLLTAKESLPVILSLRQIQRKAMLEDSSDMAGECRSGTVM